MQEILNAISSRRARRAINPDRPVPADTLERVLGAAHLAPSCSNNQSWRFLVLSESGALEAGQNALTGGNYWAKRAPILIAICTNPEDDCQLSDGRDYALFDTGMATGLLMTQASAEGLYAHPMAGFSPGKVRAAFGIEPPTIVVTVLALGYPGSTEGLSEKHLAQESAERDRKPLESVVFHNAWMPAVPHNG